MIEKIGKPLGRWAKKKAEDRTRKKYNRLSL
jgi:hypothetical protein